MSAGSNVTGAYRYDGTWDGLLCCLFETYVAKEMPYEIFSHEELQQTLYPAREIITDPAKANRVRQAIPAKISKAARTLAEEAFLTCLPQKEVWILRFLRLGFQQGAKVMGMLAHPVVNTLNKAVLHLNHESHQYCGFVRFNVSGGALWAVIEPKNQVLPLLATHFCERFSNEAFLIYDKTHDMALVYQSGRHEILPLLAFEPPEPDETELKYRALWRTFYDAINIRERESLRGRMSHMQKRYWKHLTEMQAKPIQYKKQQADQSTPPEDKHSTALSSLF